MKKRSALARLMRAEREARGWSTQQMAEEMTAFSLDQGPVYRSWVSRVENATHLRGPEPFKLHMAAAAFAATPAPGQKRRTMQEYLSILNQAAGYGGEPLPFDDPVIAEAIARIRRSPHAAQVLELIDQLSPEQQRTYLRMLQAMMEDQAESVPA